MIALWLALLASAAPTITLNGADISAVRDQRFSAVDVWIDEDGTVHLTSDRYAVKTPGGEAAAASETEGGPQADTDGAAESTASDPPPRVTGPEPTAGVPASTGGEGSARPSPAVAPGSWWLATEDNGSRGHEIRVFLNGNLVQTVRSGDPQVIEDVSRYLEPGANQVLIQTSSENAGGGGLYVYLGEGRNEGGTVTLERPTIQHGLGPSRRGNDVREYSLIVAEDG